ncbi:MAG TPA: hypothetical protein VNQ77_10890 [Frankiaceae bacterium]|nr:hypothetical protein [Frankiaceae bacterium]
MGTADVVITAVATLTAALGTQLFAARADRQRRADERALRAADRAHELRLALREDRLAAYRAVKVAIREQVASHDEFAARRATRLLLTDAMRRPAAEQPQDLIAELDANNAELRAAAVRATAADRAVQAALDAAEIVASAPVADAIRHLSTLVMQLRSARNTFAGTGMDDPSSVDAWTAVLAAERALDEGRAAVDAAIRTELGLDG